MRIGLIFTLLLVLLNNKIARVEQGNSWKFLKRNYGGARHVLLNAQAHLHSGNWIRSVLCSPYQILEWCCI